MPESPAGEYVLVTTLVQEAGSPLLHVYGPMTRSAARKAQQAYLAHPSVLASLDRVRTNVCRLQGVLPR